jgi:hypothetical protein
MTLYQFNDDEEHPRKVSVSANRAAIHPSMHLLQNPEKHTAFIQLGLT